MKKSIFYISCIVITLLPTQLAAECNSSCKISDAPAPALTEYFTNVEKITENILSALSEAEAIESTNKKQERNRVIAGLNSILRFGDFFGSFDYHISLPITNEVPREVRRDHDRIERQTDKLKNILEKAEKRATAGTKVENVCNGVSYCTLPDNSARSILTQVINNNQQIAQLYRASVTEKPALAADITFILVASDFRGQIESYYNKDTLTACSECEGGFMETIREKISNISFKNGDYKEGVQKWKDAWAMLRGGSKSNPGYKKREAELLSQYLTSQGMAGSQSDAILSNLDRYNEGGLSASNPLFNSDFKAQGDIDLVAKTFEETLSEKFSGGAERVPTVELVRVDTQLKGDEDISKSIDTLYNNQIPFAFSQDTQALELQLRIMRMHVDLTSAIKMLGKQVKSTEKNCDKQGIGMGKCSYR